MAVRCSSNCSTVRRAISRQADVLPLNVLLAEWPEVDGTARARTNLGSSHRRNPRNLEPPETREPREPGSEPLRACAAAPAVRQSVASPPSSWRAVFSDWVAEIRRRREERDTLFVAATPGGRAAPRAVEGIRVSYDRAIDRAEDAHYDAVLVATARPLAVFVRGRSLPIITRGPSSRRSAARPERRLGRQGLPLDLRDRKSASRGHGNTGIGAAWA